jgi:pimeloyl-ACP methyl ester carboxylesterase
VTAVPAATVNGIQIGYEEHGPVDGDPLVLVCGLGQTADTWSVSILPGLVAAGYRVITFDNRGIGTSDSPPAPYSVADMTADTAELIEHLGIGPCHVAGYSLGSWIVETLGASRPELVRSVTCIAGLNDSTEWEKIECEYGRDLAALDAPLPPTSALMELLVYLPREQVQDNDTVRAFVEMFGSDPPWQNPGRLGQWHAACEWTRTESERDRSRITVPVLAVAFAHDIDSPPAYARLAVSEIPGARFIEITDATHLGPFEHPDRVVAALTNFHQSL